MRRALVALTVFTAAALLPAPAPAHAEPGVRGGGILTLDGRATPGLFFLQPTPQSYTAVGRGYVQFQDPARGIAVGGEVSFSATAASDATGDSVLKGSGRIFFSFTSDELLPGGGRLTGGGEGRYDFAADKFVARANVGVTYKVWSYDLTLGLAAQWSPEDANPTTAMAYVAGFELTFLRF